ncbi:MAG: protein kinase [Candidatus Eisenbacteria bacterium]
MTSGEKIGPYEVIGFLGAGAMGEIHRARDTRLGRDVAIKTLPASLSLDEERIRRFDQEARAAGTLNHPNILTIYDVGNHGGGPYIVSELLVGSTLRQRLDEGALPPRRAADFAAQIARGLAAAHGSGVTHRDLKPENLFVTALGAVKILDFGLAKLKESGVGPASGDDSLAGTMTGAGAILGTLGYMAPEQVRGLPATPSSDLFALGCVLYEMITGVRAFKRDSPVESMSAILHEDPAPMAARVRSEFPALAAIVARCLEKEPAARFQSAADLAFALSLVSATDAPAGDTGAGAAAGSIDGESRISFRRLTFRRGSIQRARFTPDGHSVIYGGSWEGQPVEPFWMHLGNPEGRSIGHPGTDVFSVAANGEMAVCLKRRTRGPFLAAGTLARMPVGGGAPRQLLQNVDEADWSPEGTQFAVVREVDSMNRLEYPIGRVLFQTHGWISHMRVSRDGKHVAFVHHEYVGNDGGDVTVVDTEGRSRVLSGDWGTIRGLAWSADGSEVWFTAHRASAGRNLYAVGLDGRLRALHQVPGQLCIQDVFPDGRVLLTHSVERQAIMVQVPGESTERDLSWLDWSILRDISDDGQWLLIVESGEGGGSHGAICIRPTDGSGAVQLGEGNAMRFSPDGMWVLALQQTPGLPGSVVLLPTGVGEPRQVDTGGIECRVAKWVPDGKSILVLGSDGDGPVCLHRVDLESGRRVQVGPSEAVDSQFEISPDSRFVAAKVGNRPLMLYPLEAGDAIAIPGVRPDDMIQPWRIESGAILVAVEGEMPAKILRVDLATGTRSPYRELAPPDSSGVWSMRGFHFLPDGRTYGYTYLVQLDDLYLVENLS